MLRSIVVLTLCTGAIAPLARSQAPAPAAPGTFTISGDPESADGATWTFQGSVDRVKYDLTGVLLKPTGGGPFPAVVLSHGAQGSAAMIARTVGRTMRDWGLVCIAVNYTHATGVPIGSPGDERDRGASRGNVERAHMAHDLLARLGYVDMGRVALHGHSMGAYLSAAAASRYPTDFRVASTTGGGIRPDRFLRARRRVRPTCLASESRSSCTTATQTRRCRSTTTNASPGCCCRTGCRTSCTCIPGAISRRGLTP